MNPTAEMMVHLPLPYFSNGRLSYTNMYTPIDPFWLIDNFGSALSPEEELESITRFAIQKKINPLPDISNCVSIAFFCKDSNSRGDNPLPSPSMEKGEAWQEKYLKRFETLVADFHRMPFFEGWKIRAYMESSMIDFVPQLLEDRIEFYVMEEDSVGSCPGTLWRHLALGDQSLEIVFVADIDETIKDKVKFIEAFLADETKAVGRFIQYPTPKGFFVEDSRIAKSYAAILGGVFAARPKLFDFDIKKAITSWVRMRMRSIQSENPWKIGPLDVPTMFNIAPPSGRHPYGWGNHIHTYGFNERFLKHVVYPFAASNGLLQTWTNYHWQEMQNLNDEIMADLNYISRHPDNTLVLTKPKNKPKALNA